MLGVGIYTIVTELLVIAGIWKILMKCGEKGWYAIIPGLRYYKLGACNGKERDGLRCLFLEIIVRIMSFFDTEGATGKSPHFALNASKMLEKRLNNISLKES